MTEHMAVCVLAGAEHEISTLRTLRDSGPALLFLKYAHKARPIQLTHPQKYFFSQKTVPIASFAGTTCR